MTAARDQLKQSLALEARQMKAIEAGYQAVADDTAATLAKLQQQLTEDGGLSRSEMYKFGRLEKVQAQVLASLDRLHAGEPGRLNDALGEQFDLGYFFTGYNLEKKTGLSLAYAALDADQMRAASLSSLAKISLESAQEETRRRIRRSIVIATAQGEGISKLGERIRDDLGQNANDVYRIARTETTRVNNEGCQASFDHAKSRGLPLKKEWISTLDAKTRESHQRMDGEVVELDARFSNGLMQPGELGGPPQEVIRCRCTMGAVLAGYEKDNQVRRARNAETGKNEVVKDVPYSEWRQTKVNPLSPTKQAAVAQQATQAAAQAAIEAKARQAAIDAQNAQIAAQAMADIQANRAANDAAEAAARARAAEAARQAAEAEAARQAAEAAAARKAAGGAAAQAEAAAKAPAYIDHYKPGYDAWAAGKSKAKTTELAQALLDGEGVPLTAVTKRMNARGAFGYYMPGNDRRIRPASYTLQAGDKRPLPYKVKTTFHELFHAKASGLVTDENFKLAAKAYNSIEETFAECYGHFAAKRMGVTYTIAPSYSDYLVNTLPRLKKLPEFAHCTTIADFGQVAEKYRFGSGSVTAEWRDLYDKTQAVTHDYLEYGRQYNKFIATNTGEITRQLIEGGAGSVGQEAMFESVIGSVVGEIESGGALYLRPDQKSVYQHVLAIAMNMEGIR